MSKQILHVVNSYFALPYFIGEQFVYFKDKGYDLHVVCSPSPYLRPYAIKMGFNFKEVKIARAITPFKDLKAIFHICRYILKNNIDIVVGHTPKGALVSMIASFIMRCPKRIYFRHGLVYETSKGLKRSLLINIERLTALLSTKIVCVSPSLFELSLTDRLNKREKQIVLGRGTCGGIDTQVKFNPDNINVLDADKLRKNLGIPNGAYVIGYCGRLVRDKGITELVEAFSGLKNKYPAKKFNLLLVGMFEERDALSSETRQQISEDKNIIYTGFVNESIEYYYSIMDVYVLPSYREGFGISVIEASSMRKPVLTTRATGCIDSIIESFTGVYIENNSGSVLKGLEYYFQNPSISISHGINGREFVVENFEQCKFRDEIENLY